MDPRYVLVLMLATLVVDEVRFAIERRAQRAHVERLERMLASKNMGEFAATEAILTRAPSPEPQQQKGPRLWDEAFSSPPRSSP